MKTKCNELPHGELQLGYTAGDLAAAIGLPRQTVDYAIRTKSLKALRSGRRYIVLREDALAWLKKCRESGVIPTPVSERDRQNLAQLNQGRKSSKWGGAL